jgi:hypothetical protein
MQRQVLLDRQHKNLYVSSGSQAVTTTSSIVSGFGASTTGTCKCIK